MESTEIFGKKALMREPKNPGCCFSISYSFMAEISNFLFY